MTEVCVNGHIRTEENTRYYQWGRGSTKLKRRCLDCTKKESNGRPSAREMQIQRTTELHEDIEDMIRFGATFHEIVHRSGYTSWPNMRRSLNKRGRHDLLEKMRLKQV